MSSFSERTTVRSIIPQEGLVGSITTISHSSAVCVTTKEYATDPDLTGNASTEKKKNLTAGELLDCLILTIVCVCFCVRVRMHVSTFRGFFLAWPRQTAPPLDRTEEQAVHCSHLQKRPEPRGEPASYIPGKTLTCHWLWSRLFLPRGCNRGCRWRVPLGRIALEKRTFLVLFRLVTCTCGVGEPQFYISIKICRKQRVLS